MTYAGKAILAENARKKLCKAVNYYPPLARFQEHPARWLLRKITNKNKRRELGNLRKHVEIYVNACLNVIFSYGLFGTGRELRDGALTGYEVLGNSLSSSLSFTVRRFIEHGGPVPNLLKPQRFSERLIVQKYFGRVSQPSPEDKLLCKTYVPNNVCDLLESFERPFISDAPVMIDNECVPEGRYFWKTNHSTGLYRRVKFPADIEIREKMFGDAKQWLNVDGNERQGQWWNKLVERKVYLEQDLSDAESEVKDWKLFVIGSKVRIIQVDTDRVSGHDQVAYDRDFNKLKHALYYNGKLDHERPKRLADMIEIAEAIGANFDVCRVDLYYVDDLIYLGEITIIPVSALRPPISHALDRKLGMFWPPDSVVCQSLDVAVRNKEPVRLH